MIDIGGVHSCACQPCMIPYLVFPHNKMQKKHLHLHGVIVRGVLFETEAVMQIR